MMALSMARMTAILAAFAVQGTIGATTRALPASAVFHGLQDEIEDTTVGSFHDAVQDIAFNAINNLQSLHEDGEETIDILVTPYLLGLQGLGEQQDHHLHATKTKLHPTQRLSLPSLPSILPHFNTSCSCEHWKCSCCAGVEISPLKKNKTGCVSLAYISDRLAIQLQLSINNRTLLERDLISGSNPPPFCFPPIPTIPIVNLCLRLANISLLTQDAKVQACASVEVGLIFTPPLIRLRFGCIKIGRDGIAWSSTPSYHSMNLTAINESQSALQQFAATLNSTENEQFQLLQSILRQQEIYEQSQTTLPLRNQKTAWSTVMPRNSKNNIPRTVSST